MRHGVGKPKAQLIARVATTDKTGEKTVHEGEEEVHGVLSTNIATRYSQGNNSPFLSGQLLGDLGYMGERTAVEDILKDTYVFPEECPK